MSSSKGKGVASSNWLALQKQLDSEKRKSSNVPGSTRKRRRVEEEELGAASISVSTREPSTSRNLVDTRPSSGAMKSALQQMVLGSVEHSDAQVLPGKYLALDCEMVGVGIDGAESSLARVSLVNFYGAVILDEFVRQKERVVDYRTQWSGIRESDMVKANSFEEVQKKVSDLLENNVLIGHAVHNDLKALLLSHPRASTRDTQYYAHKFGLTKSSRIALRNLVKQELDLTIQSGEHSSVTDARATMAVYRLHKQEWEKNNRVFVTHSKLPAPKTTESPEPSELSNSSKRRKQDKAPQSFPGGGRKGVSSGLSTVTRRVGVKGKEDSKAESRTKQAWWERLPGSLPGSSAKGSIQVKRSLS